ncbi:MAG TPA: metallophosphoesterase [Candidatus Fimivicinus intestinavium]|nr:metallophosphoesterase [Candidatus Fimivicinus intestinavium]
MLTFYQITDLHFYAAKALDACGEAWERRAKYDQKCVAESEAIIDCAFDKLLADRETEIVLISGDLVCDGERLGHLELKKKLDRLAAGGKRVFVLTATHDIHPEPKGYSRERGEYVVDGLTKPALLELYRAFGPADALSVHEASFSYVAHITDGYRLFVLNDDGDGYENNFYGYSRGQMRWLEEQLRIGRESGDVLLAMGHHPLLPPSPIYPVLSPHEMTAGGPQVAQLLADAGVQFLFTGHTHMQNINFYDSPRGNRLFEINTASLIGYPSPIRKMALDGHSLKVETQHIEAPAFDLGGKTYMEYSRAHFEFMLRDIFDSAAHDYDRFCELAPSFSLPSKTARQLRAPIHALGKFLDQLTFEKAGRLLLCKSKIAPELYHTRLCDFLVGVIRNIYGGDEPYAPGTPEHDSFMALYSRIAPLLQKLKPEADFDRVIEGVLYDGGYPDNDAVLEAPRYIAE